MAVNTASGWKISIGPTTPAANATAYALLSYVLIGETQNLGEFGDQSADVTFVSISDSRVRHIKGPRDAGVLPLVVGHDPLDPGQVALKAAEKTKFSYAFKVEAADAPDEDHTDSIFYFHAQVQASRLVPGQADSVVMRNFPLGITTEVFEVPAEEVTP